VLITRDGYVIKRIDARENPPGAHDWRADGHNVFALTLTFANTPCAPVDLLQRLLDLPRFPTDLTGPEPGDYVIFSRYTSWGGIFIDARNARPDCVTDMGINVNPPPPRES
jgi:hypothetical protein